MQETGISTLMLTYNILDQSMAQEVMPAAQANGIGVFARQPLTSGLLSGQLTPDTIFAENDYRQTWRREKFLTDLQRVEAIKVMVGDAAPTLPQAALKFILAHPAVSSVIPGMMTPVQVDDGIAASGGDPLPPEVIRKLRELGAR
jgi:aryl-alcohol dehydrogenase-like predicted oxidoreductase